MIESLVEQIESRFAELAQRDDRPRGHQRSPALRRGRARVRAPGGAGQARRAVAPRAPTTPPGARGAPRRGRGPRGARDAGQRAPAHRGARRGDPPGDGRARSRRRQGRHRRGPGRRRRRGGRAVGGRRLPDADQVRRAPRLQGAAAGDRRRQVHLRRSTATAPTRSSSTRAARTACSACRSPSRRAVSTPRRRRSPCCPRPRTSTSRSIPTTCRSTSTARRARAGSRSTPPTRRCASRTSRPASSSRCRTRRASCRTASKAMRVLRARLYEQALAEQQAELAADRRAQVGTGDRAEKIRTYNYGERRVTDHRIKLTVHNLDAVLEGELDELTAGLSADEKRRRLEVQAAAPTSRWLVLRPPCSPAPRSACRRVRRPWNQPSNGRHAGARGARLRRDRARRRRGRHAAPGRRGAARPRARHRPPRDARRRRRDRCRARRCASSRTPCAGARWAASRWPTSRA